VKKKNTTIRKKLIKDAYENPAEYHDYWKRRVDAWRDAGAVTWKELESFVYDDRKKP